MWYGCMLLQVVYTQRTFFDEVAKLNSILVHPDVPIGKQAGDTLVELVRHQYFDRQRGLVRIGCYYGTRFISCGVHAHRMQGSGNRAQAVQVIPCIQSYIYNTYIHKYICIHTYLHTYST